MIVCVTQVVGIQMIKVIFDVMVLHVHILGKYDHQTLDDSLSWSAT